MGTEFNADEVFLIAEQIEANGADFYTRAAGFATRPAVKRMLTDLATMEVSHQQTFAAMRAGLSEADRAAATFDPVDEAAAYLKALADSRVFDKSSPALRLTGSEPPADVLRRAIGLEQDSIAFYTGMVELVGSARGQEQIEAIIHEEMRHVATLTGQLMKL